MIAVPQLLYMARQRRLRSFVFVIDAVSFLATPLAGAAVRRALPATTLPADAVRLLVVGAAMLCANYLAARLTVAVIRDRADPWILIRTELLKLAPLELAVIAIGAGCALVLPVIGVPALLGIVVLAYLPQLAAVRLLRAPSVAQLSVNDAAGVYREAIVDELGLDRHERRQTHQVDSLVEEGRPDSLPDNLLAIMKDALIVQICSARAPVQRHFFASQRAQVVLVARRWAELTARCTPALSHTEALQEIRTSSLQHDAPSAVAAALRIVEREQALSEHVAGVPHLHRAPLPRSVRHTMLPSLAAFLSA